MKTGMQLIAKFSVYLTGETYGFPRLGSPKGNDMSKRSTFDRMVEEPDFYVRVQKTKLIVAGVLLVVAAFANHWFGL